MGVDHGQRRVFLGQVLHQRNQGGVLENVGMVACVEGVAVRKHGAIVPSCNAKTMEN